MEAQWSTTKIQWGYSTVVVVEGEEMEEDEGGRKGGGEYCGVTVQVQGLNTDYIEGLAEKM